MTPLAMMLMGGMACVSAFTGPVGFSSFGGVSVIESVDAMTPVRRPIVTPTMGGKENEIR